MALVSTIAMYMGAPDRRETRVSAHRCLTASRASVRARDLAPGVSMLGYRVNSGPLCHVDRRDRRATAVVAAVTTDDRGRYVVILAGGGTLTLPGSTVIVI